MLGSNQMTVRYTIIDDHYFLLHFLPAPVCVRDFNS